MRMRWPVALAGLVLLLAGCTPVSRPTGEHFTVPEDLAWRYITSCLLDGDLNPVSGETTFTVEADGAMSVSTSEQGSDAEAYSAATEACLNRYHYQASDTFQYVSGYERAQLFDWYTRSTRPCLADHGVAVPLIDRAEFFVPDRRVWNPYTGMDQIPFEQLIALYQACPPVPGYLTSRHEH